ncbi:HAMP domain-containing sensor histidine kinase [Virgibacillus sp. W0430]|uniref:HAMP domain-containing sensor histidine kinase n=1 Tax=Virgibacillus sp. W0430 TaxID=3391580 RepID=UPI003F48FEF0
MKLKTWLLLSYLIVMILPIFAAYLLFAWINSYYSDQKVQEYFKKTIELQEIKSVLEQPQLYRIDADKTPVKQLESEQLSISLYNQDGLVIYASNPSLTLNALGKKKLYKNLYSLEQGYQSFTYRQPVFQEQELVGFFNVELLRKEWKSNVSGRSLFMFSVFLALFMLIYFTVVRMVNQKLNVRLSCLMTDMTAFASGKTIVEKETSNDEIGILKKHFYRMSKQISEAQQAIQKEQKDKEFMIATISHDLKTPLTSIKAYAESLHEEQGLSVKERDEYRQVIVQKADFMKQMLEDLLTYTLLQSSSYELEFVRVDGMEFFDMLISGYDPLCKEKDIHLQASSNVSGSFLVNPKQMMRVTDNLMSNAIKYSRSGNHIWVVAANDESMIPWLFDFVDKSILNFEQYVYLVVQNEGKGIKKEHLNNVFDPMYQVDQARSKKDAHGTGLGLSITKQIIEKHEGSIQIYSEESIGTTVLCSLPRTKGR